MKCDKVRELLPFLDNGSLEKNKVDKTRAHLVKCAECLKEYEEIKNVLNMVGSALIQDETQTGNNLLDAVLKGIEKKKKAQKFRKWIYSAAAVVIFAISVSIYSLLTTSVHNNVSNQVAITESNDEFYNYITQYYLDTNELIELSEEIGVFDEDDINDALYQYEYLDSTFDDIIEILDEYDITSFIKEI